MTGSGQLGPISHYWYTFTSGVPVGSYDVLAGTSRALGTWLASSLSKIHSGGDGLVVERQQVVTPSIMTYSAKRRPC